MPCVSFEMTLYQKISFTISTSSFGLILFALFLQHIEGIEPCPLCILQRYVFVSITLVSLLAGLIGKEKIQILISGSLIIILSIIGGLISGRHIFLELNPQNQFDCGADLNYMVEAFPLSELLPMIFSGTGDCGIAPWHFLSLSIAEWAFFWFGIYLIAAAVSTMIAVRSKNFSKEF